MPAVLRTRTGRRLSQGVPADRALNLGTVDDPHSLERYLALATDRDVQ